MKKSIYIISCTLVLCVLFLGKVVAAPTIIMNDKNLNFDVPPVIKNGYALVPLRTIFEANGSNIEWNEVTQTVIATKSNIVVKLTIGKNTAYRNNQKYILDITPQIINGRTMVPLRFVSEALGSSVKWNSNTQTVYIYDDNVKNGYHEVTFSNGAKYEGSWKNDEFSGFGTYTSNDGIKYVGEFANNKFNGQGFIYFPNGSEMTGNWTNNLLDGIVMFRDPNGYISKTEYRNGNIINQTPTTPIQTITPPPISQPTTSNKYNLELKIREIEEEYNRNLEAVNHISFVESQRLKLDLGQRGLSDSNIYGNKDQIIAIKYDKIRQELLRQKELDIEKVKRIYQ